MNDDLRLTRASRWFAGALALLWLGVGAAAVGVAAVASRWLFLLIGAGAVWYGLAWLRVARLNRRLGLREMLMLDLLDLLGKRFRD